MKTLESILSTEFDIKERDVEPIRGWLEDHKVGHKIASSDQREFVKLLQKYYGATRPKEFNTTTLTELVKKGQEVIIIPRHVTNLRIFSKYRGKRCVMRCSTMDDNRSWSEPAYLDFSTMKYEYWGLWDQSRHSSQSSDLPIEMLVLPKGKSIQQAFIDVLG